MDLYRFLLDVEDFLQLYDPSDGVLYLGLAKARDSALLEIAARPARTRFEYCMKVQAFNGLWSKIPEHGLLQTLIHSSLQADIENLQIEETEMAREIRGH